jgi:hypothetical protein
MIYEEKRYKLEGAFVLKLPLSPKFLVAYPHSGIT